VQFGAGNIFRISRILLSLVILGFTVIIPDFLAETPSLVTAGISGIGLGTHHAEPSK
jgi:hypothetical protein